MKKYYCGPNGFTNRYHNCIDNAFAVYYDSKISIVLYSTHQTIKEAQGCCDLMNRKNELMKRRNGI